LSGGRGEIEFRKATGNAAGKGHGYPDDSWRRAIGGGGWTMIVTSDIEYNTRNV
jgi:hypothetical protein